MKAIRLLLLLVPILLTLPALAQDRFVIEDIRVEGLQRISAGTVFNYLPVGVGGSVGPEDYPELIRALFQTGFFTDVSLARDGNVLIVRVVERPAVAEINISGNNDIGTDDLREALRQVGLAEGQVFDRALLDQVEQELLGQYYSRGKYAVRIDSGVRPLPRNRVAVNLDISEGVAARIRQINIVGNQAFDDDDLIDEFQLTTPGWFTLFTKADQYSREKLTGDLETLRSFYLDRGYLNFQIDSTQVSLSPDKQDIYITINVTEGEPYTIDRIALGGNPILPEEELRPLIEIGEGEVFSRRRVSASAQALVDRLGEDGYAFANVDAMPQIDETTRQVALTFVIDPGSRVYVRRINFAGNLKTQDQVLRREMRQSEGGWFSTPDVERSRVRLQRLEYLAGVDITPNPVPGTSDQVDLDVMVEERPAGSVTFGVGYGQAEGVLFNAGVRQSNFLGTGNEAGFVFNNSAADTRYSLSFNNPYYTPDGVSRGFRINYEETDASELNTADYVVDRLDGQLQYGFPLNETDTLRIGFGIEDLTLKTTENSPQEIIDDIATNGDDYFNYKLDAGLGRDTRNRLIFPDSGSLNRLSLEVALPGSDAEFYKIGFNHRSYYPLTDDLTFSLRGFVGYGDGLGDFDGLPFWEKYLAGGLRSVRGFEANTLGPQFSNNEPSGGDLLLVTGAEVIRPVPFLQNSENFRISGFFDIGNVYDKTSDFDAGELRYSVGVAFQWLSPLGPLAFSFAQPLNEGDEDEVERFQFSFGIPF